MRFRHVDTIGAAALTPGTWMHWTAEFTNGSKIMAVCCCPNGHLGSLSTVNHRILPDGTVTPSYVCPRSDCGFHTFIALDGWVARDLSMQKSG